MGNFNLCKVLLIIFIVLKVIGQIDWSWWYVFIPLYVELGLHVLLAVLEKLQDKYDPMWRIREQLKKGR